MRSKFPGFDDNYLEKYILSSKKVTVVFDTNILLNLYRYEKKIANDIVSQIKSLKRNDFFEVWLPHQVALEFNLQRKSTFKTQGKAVQMFKSDFDSFRKRVRGLAQVGGKNSELAPLQAELGPHFHEISNIIEKHFQKHKKTKRDDKVIDQVYEIFDGVVGENYSLDKMCELEKEGEYRYLHNIPPGFDDYGKEITYSYLGTKIESKYGDFILWSQLIDKAIDSQTALIFVTGDEKPDWQSKDFGRVHPELINEFKLKTGHDFYALSLPNFQRYFEPKLKRKLSKETTTEITNLNFKDNSGWLEEILEVFYCYNRPLALKEISRHFYENTERDLPPTWEKIILRTICNHCSDVKAYLGKKDIFKRVESGLYELR